MMKIFKRGIVAAGLAGLVVGLVVACGGGGGAVAGIDRLGVTNGTITGFGSIFVNGVEYETGNATSIVVDDSPGTESELQVGQVVTINWASNDNGVTFRAADVTYNKSLEGPIASINSGAQSFVVLGQTVVVDSGTSFDSGIVPQDVTGLLVGDNVEVSGLIDAAGDIRATRVERKAVGGTLEVRGAVGTVTATTFDINDQVVNYASATLTGFSGPIAAGDFVEAKGTSVNGSGELVATEVKLEDEGLPRGGDGDEGEAEGFVTAFTSPASFSVNGVPVVTQAATVVTGGVVALNVKVEVRGAFNASGELVADSIKVKTGSSGDAVNARLRGNVEGITIATSQLVVLGVTVRVDASTRIEDQRDDQRPFGLANLSVGDNVEIRGVLQGDGSVLATLLEREDASSNGMLRGPISALSEPNFTLLGRTIATDGSTDFDDSNFFSTAAVGTEVEVKFSLDALGAPGDPILASAVEIDD
jgi:hypothetical protein